MRWLLVAVLISGCSALSTRPEGPVDTIASKYEQYLVDKYTGNANDSREYDGPDWSWRHYYDNVPSYSTKEAERNIILNELIILININYFRYEDDMYASAAYFNMAADLTNLAIAGAGTFAPPGASNALAAVSAGLSGARLSIDKNMFQEKSRIAIIDSMRASRGNVLLDIEKGMGRSTRTYSLESGIIDIIDYFYAGTLIGALEQITQQANQQIAEDQEELRGLRSGLK